MMVVGVVVVVLVVAVVEVELVLVVVVLGIQCWWRSQYEYHTVFGGLFLCTNGRKIRWDYLRVLNQVAEPEINFLHSFVRLGSRILRKNRHILHERCSTNLYQMAKQRPNNHMWLSSARLSVFINWLHWNNEIRLMTMISFCSNMSSMMNFERCIYHNSIVSRITIESSTIEAHQSGLRCSRLNCWWIRFDTDDRLLTSCFAFQCSNYCRNDSLEAW